MIALDADVQIAQKFGWTRDREFDPTEWIGELQSRRFAVLDSGVACLRAFGGLDLIFEDEAAEPHLPYDRIRFDPRGTTIDELRYWEERAEKHFAPIGEADEIACLFTDQSGAWYVAYVGLWQIGANANKALRYALLGDGDRVTVCPPCSAY
jgi:hypothetical protein